MGGGVLLAPLLPDELPGENQSLADSGREEEQLKFIALKTASDGAVEWTWSVGVGDPTYYFGWDFVLADGNSASKGGRPDLKKEAATVRGRRLLRIWRVRDEPKAADLMQCAVDPGLISTDQYSLPLNKFDNDQERRNSVRALGGSSGLGVKVSYEVICCQAPTSLRTANWQPWSGSMSRSLIGANLEQSKGIAVKIFFRAFPQKALWCQHCSSITQP